METGIFRLHQQLIEQHEEISILCNKQNFLSDLFYFANTVAFGKGLKCSSLTVVEGGIRKDIRWQLVTGNYKSSMGNFKIMPLTTSNKLQAMV